MQKTIDETQRRRKKQIEYNYTHGITPTQIVKSRQAILGQTMVVDTSGKLAKAYVEPEGIDYAADPVVQYMTKEQLQKRIAEVKRAMEAAAREMDFMEAARRRDEMLALKKLLEEK
jgi:excinuclease ABC subunit B